jgi:hypothetical protein
VRGSRSSARVGHRIGAWIDNQRHVWVGRPVPGRPVIVNAHCPDHPQDPAGGPRPPKVSDHNSYRDPCKEDAVALLAGTIEREGAA